MMEKRRFSRVKESKASFLYPAGEGTACSLEDISCGGLCFNSKEDVLGGPGLRGEIKLSNPRLKSTLTIPASIKPVWSQKIGERFKIGAEFIDISDQDKDFILKRVDSAVQRQAIHARRRKFVTHSLLIAAVAGGAALFIFQQRVFTSIQDSLKTALYYSEKDRSIFKSALDSTIKEREALQIELDDTEAFLTRAEGLLKSDRIKFSGEIARLKKDIRTLKTEVVRLSDRNMKLDGRLHDLKELRLAVRDVKREIRLKRIGIQERLDRARSLAGNKGYIIKDRKFTSGTKGVTINVLPGEARGMSNWE